MLKLSEAIRLGSMLHRQHFGAMRDVVNGKIIATCALGAAHVAGFDTQRMLAMEQLLRGHLTCPVCDHPNLTLGPTITHLNDEHMWTRERIADWVESVEQPIGLDTLKPASSPPSLVGAHAGS